MRNNLFLMTAAMAALMLASCQKSEPVSASHDNDAIGFAPYIGRDVTKAAVTDVTASNLTSFNAACYLTGSATSYFDYEQPTSRNAAGYWETADTYYWLTNINLDFFAYSGSGSSAVSNADGMAKVSYTVPDAATEDFAVAYAINQGKPSASPYAQSLNFSHALSKVSSLTLAPKAGDASADGKYRYVVTDVRISRAKNSADYTFNPASGSNWGTASGEQDYVFGDKSFNFLGNSSHKLEVGTESKVNDQLIILPQTATFSVTYSVEYSCDGGTTWTEIMASATKIVDIEMEAGKAYTVKLQLPNDASPIVYDAGVVGWSNVTVYNFPVFSVSYSKKVEFTKGNLYWDGSAFHLESSQTAYPSTWDPSHVGHFFWSQTDSVAYAPKYSDASAAKSDKFFCGEDNKLTVDGQSDLYALSRYQWNYLLLTRSVNGGTGEGKSYQRATVNSVYGFIIYPDGYTAQTSDTSYDSATWNTMEEAGCVFLPAASNRSGNTIYKSGFGTNIYWTTSVYNEYDAHGLSFHAGSSPEASSAFDRHTGSSVRLVYDPE